MYKLMSGCFSPARPEEASGLVWPGLDSGWKKVPLTSYRTGSASQLDLTLLWQRQREGCCYTAQWEGFRLTVCECVQDPKVDAVCVFRGVSVPGRSCSTFVWNMAGCRTWTWAPGGSRPQCSHLYTLQGGDTGNNFIMALRVMYFFSRCFRNTAGFQSKYQEISHFYQPLLLKDFLRSSDIWPVD